MDIIGPLLPQQLVIVGGGTKQGKSTLIEQMVCDAAMNRHPVWVMSGEMSMEELAHRALSRMPGLRMLQQSCRVMHGWNSTALPAVSCVLTKVRLGCRI